MEIEILKMDDLRCALDGWRLSRDVTSHPLVDEVATVDAPVNELPSAMLHFKDFMIMEREIFVTPRNHVMWARTSRVDDPLDYKVPTELVGFIDRTSHRELKQNMTNAKRAGVAQDEWRMGLPLSALTSWTTRISFRDLVKLTGYFSYLSIVSNAPLGVRFDKVAAQMTKVLDNFTGSRALTREVLTTMQPVKFLNEVPELLGKNGIVNTHGFTTLTLSIPIALRAQAVRHRNLAFVDTFFQVLKQPTVLDMTIGSHIDIEMCATKSVWHSIISKRSCWIAQHDLWAPIVKHFGPELLPCAGGTCPYAKDAALRLTKADPGVPCPRYCNLYDIDKEPWLEDMKHEAALRGSQWNMELH